MRIVHEAHAVCDMVRWSTRAVGGARWSGSEGRRKGFGGALRLNVVYFIKHTTRRDDIGGLRKNRLVIGETFEVLSTCNCTLHNLTQYYYILNLSRFPLRLRQKSKHSARVSIKTQ